MREFKTQLFTSGSQTVLSDEVIAQDASSGSLSWLTRNGRLELSRGRQIYGTNTTLSGGVDVASEPQVGGTYAQIFAPARNGELRHYRKINERIQLYHNGDWVDVIDGLTTFSDVFFAPYSSVAGNFLYIGCQDGLYKINLANPRSFKDMFDETRNHQGFILINESRMFLWNRFDGQGDKTALYLSKIDPQGTNYTQVNNENKGASGNTTYTGTLTAITGKRFALNVSFVGITASGTETFIDSGDGTLSSSQGGTGTINYSTGEFGITFSEVTTTGNILANYKWEDSNDGGITDFRFSTPRVAGEGDIIPQEFLAEPIQNVIPFNGKYYSVKKTCVYELDLTIDDTNATNIVYRTDIGILSPRSVFGTGLGIVYIDNSNPDRPKLSMLMPNPVGSNLEPVDITPTFDWFNYKFDKAIIDSWGEFILVSCRTPDVENNNRLMLVNTSQKYSVDVTYYGSNSFAKNGGVLYGGGSLSELVYTLFIENDDDGTVINNFWSSKNENFGDDSLKKVRYLDIKGLIDPNQSFEIYADFDGTGNQLVGTILGSASYVDTSNPQLVESGSGSGATASTIGGDTIGGGTLGGGLQENSVGDTIIAFPFYTRIKIQTPKFRVRKLVFIALGFGFCAVDMIKDFDIMLFEQRIPRVFRQKQYVSKDGTQTDLPQFEN